MYNLNTDYLACIVDDCFDLYYPFTIQSPAI